MKFLSEVKLLTFSLSIVSFIEVFLNENLNPIHEYLSYSNYQCFKI